MWNSWENSPEESLKQIPGGIPRGILGEILWSKTPEEPVDEIEFVKEIQRGISEGNPRKMFLVLMILIAE